MMNPYDDLSDDNFIAFLQLEREFREAFENQMEGGNNWEWHAPDYMNKVLAAAAEFEIDALKDHVVPEGKALDYDGFSTFQRDVEHVIVRMRIQLARRANSMRAALNSEQKAKLHGYVTKMRSEIDVSLASTGKKEAIFDLLAKLDAEIDKDRTGYERIGDLARHLAGLSGVVANDGAEPWWKWFKLFAGVIDEAYPSG